MKNAFDIIRRPVITEQSMESVADKKYVEFFEGMV